jgi:hypothetical protein
MQEVSSPLTGPQQRTSGTLVFIEPPSLDARIERQEAILSVYINFHDEDSQTDYTAYFLDIERRLSRDVITKVTIPQRFRQTIKAELEQRTRITLYQMFPDLSGLGRWLAEQNRARLRKQCDRSQSDGFSF